MKIILTKVIIHFLAIRQRLLQRYPSIYFYYLNNIANKIYWAGDYNNVSKSPGTPRNFMINLGCNFNLF